MEPNMGLASCQPRSFHAVDAEFVVVVAVAAAAAIMHYNFTRGERERESLRMDTSIFALEPALNLIFC